LTPELRANFWHWQDHFVAEPLARARKFLAAYPELVAVFIAAVIGLSVQPPLAWLAEHDGINILLAILVFATAVTIDPAELRRLGSAWPRLLAALGAGVTVLPALSWVAAHLVPSGPLRDGTLTVGLAPAEIASVATTAMAGGAAALSAGVLIGSTVTTVLLAAPILRLESAHAAFSTAGLMVNLTLVVALPLAAGIALRALAHNHGNTALAALATPRGEAIASRIALASVAALVALIAAEVHLSSGYLAVAAALTAFLAASALVGNLIGARTAPPDASALLLTTSMRDFAIAAALAAAAFGPRAAAPLGLYGILVLLWGTAAAGHLRQPATQPRR
jgi:predicted Na+-dependent transporter